jgi:hypothetical protein
MLEVLAGTRQLTEENSADVAELLQRLLQAGEFALICEIVGHCYGMPPVPPRIRANPH